MIEAAPRREVPAAKLQKTSFLRVVTAQGVLQVGEVAPRRAVLSAIVAVGLVPAEPRWFATPKHGVLPRRRVARKPTPVTTQQPSEVPAVPPLVKAEVVPLLDAVDRLDTPLLGFASHDGVATGITMSKPLLVALTMPLLAVVETVAVPNGRL